MFLLFFSHTVWWGGREGKRKEQHVLERLYYVDFTLSFLATGFTVGLLGGSLGSGGEYYGFHTGFIDEISGERSRAGGLGEPSFSWDPSGGFVFLFCRACFWMFLSAFLLLLALVVFVWFPAASFKPHPQKGRRSQTGALLSMLALTVFRILRSLLQAPTTARTALRSGQGGAVFCWKRTSPKRHTCAEVDGHGLPISFKADAIKRRVLPIVEVIVNVAVLFFGGVIACHG